MIQRDRNKTVTRIIREYTNSKLDDFTEYTSEIEAKFNTDKRRLSEHYDETIKNLSEEDRRDVDDYFSDDFYMIESIYILLYRRSTLVSIYSFLEHSMDRLCRHLYAINTYPVKVDDLKGEGIVRAKDYLEKLAKVKFDALNGEWSQLANMNKIRNCIVHADGDVMALSKSRRESLLNIINNNRGISLKDERFISIEKEFISSCIGQVRTFLDKLYQQILV